MLDQPVKTRFAPSPTGYLHVGGARTALFNWLWARHTGGESHLRIEDTDQARLVDDAEKQITDSLQWLGLDWDGEIIRQSDRHAAGVYERYANQLIEQGKAYESKEAAGAAVRFKWPDNPAPIEVAYFDSGKRRHTRTFTKAETPSAFEDFVLIKSDGWPTYNFAHVIDDHEAGITDVIRGDEFISSLNKYVALYAAFDWTPPRYVHVPPILGPDKAKLSKRHGAADVLEYRDAGYLPTALTNFIALIGWSPGGDRELFFDSAELVTTFTLEGLQSSPGAFDETKLKWMNKEHMQQLPTEQLQRMAIEGGFWNPESSNNELQHFSLAAERASTLAELKLDDYYTTRPKLTAAQLVGDANPETVGVWLERVQRALESLTDWQAERLQGALNDVLSELGLKPKQLFPVLRETLTGAPQTPAIWDVMAALGQQESLARLEVAAALVA